MNAATMNEAFANAETIDFWPVPRDLPGGLLAVKAFDCAMLPQGFRPWIEDVSERMQTPPEFVAVPAMVSAGAVLGCKIAVRPARYDDWQEVPNLWGCVIGRPGVLKSPAAKNGMKPLLRLEAKANEQYKVEEREWDEGEDERAVRRDARKAALKKRLQENPGADVSDLRIGQESKPVLRRYKSNDSSYQALGDLLRENQNGLLVHRDELMSLIRALDREDNSEARGFYLTGWNGSDSYTFDRIGRGTNLFVPSVTLSVFGSTQPALLQSYIRGVVSGNAIDDGLIQRFSMAVWPDLPPDWCEIDREPNPHHRQTAYGVFERLERMRPEDLGAQIDQFDRSIPFLRFDDDALAQFKEWRSTLEARLRSDELHPALESHIAKYRKLVPSLALLHHLASDGTGPISVSAVSAALAWAEFLESHAHRIYGAVIAGTVEGAQAIIRGVRRGGLQPTFTANEIGHKNWSPLGEDRQRILASLELLEDYGWVRSSEVRPGPKGGRPTRVYAANPKGLSR